MPALIVALVLAGIATTVAIDVIAVLAGRDHPLIWPQQRISNRLRVEHWSHWPVLTVAAAAAFLGLVVLATAITRGRATVIPLDSDDPALTAAISPRSLRHTLNAAAEDVDGIHESRTAVGRRTVTIVAASDLRDLTGLQEQVSAAVAQRLSAVAPARTLRVKTRVSSRGES